MMQQVMDVDVLGARRITVDGNTYTTLFLGQRSDDADLKGVIPMKVTADPGVVDQLDSSVLPRQHKVRVRLQLAGGGKTAMHALEVLPDNAPTGGDSATDQDGVAAAASRTGTGAASAGSASATAGKKAE